MVDAVSQDSGSSSLTEATSPTKEATVSPSSNNRTVRQIARQVHLWLGLIAFAWLFVLGITGFILDHPEWRWTKQWTVTSAFGSDHIFIDETLGIILRNFHVDHTNPERMIAGGERGLWRRANANAPWVDVPYENARGLPRLLAMVPDLRAPWQRIWLATDDGIWVVHGSEGQARQVALPGLEIAALSVGSSPAELIGATPDQAFRLNVADTDTDLNEPLWISLADTQVRNMPETINLARVLTDMHLGWGLFSRDTSVLINDFGALAIAFLCVTGFVQWWLPRRWRNAKAGGRKTKAQGRTADRASTMRFIYRSHAPILGVLAVLPILYLCITGIFFDHARTFMVASKETHISRDLLFSAFDLTDMRGEITGVVGTPNKPETLSLMTRIGLVRTTDNGQTWDMVDDLPMLAHAKGGLTGTLYTHGTTFVGTHGGPIYTRHDGEETWAQIPGLRMFIQDAAKIGDEWILKGSRGFVRGTLDGNLAPIEVPLPEMSGMPINSFVADLHAGFMFTDHWIWVNDVIAIIAIFLALSGLLNLCYRRWS